jgi:hypothetical protein
MKLHFNKNDQGDIVVNIQKGTDLIVFNYIEMLQQLLQKNTIEDSDFGNLDEDEKGILTEMLKDISKAIDEGLKVDVNNQ